jgi:1-deoxy-D-xylulose-5-phosphate reductoisomerase
MMNKGLEVIETAWFFGVDGAQIEVVVHPQSVIHSLVEYCDGSTLAQLGSADMRIPIAHALAWPERMFSGAARLDLRTVGSLDFQPVDLLKFPCLRLAYEALAAGGSVPAQMNAANEVAVESFLQGGVQFLQIAQVVEEVLQRLSGRPLENLESVLAVDDEARDTALMVIQGLNS